MDQYNIHCVFVNGCISIEDEEWSDGENECDGNFLFAGCFDRGCVVVDFFTKILNEFDGL